MGGMGGGSEPPLFQKLVPEICKKIEKQIGLSGGVGKTRN